jgi:hypothetical protein
VGIQGTSITFISLVLRIRLVRLQVSWLHLQDVVLNLERNKNLSYDMTWELLGPLETAESI